jgi:hypothetical protein
MEKQTKILLGVGAVIAAYLILKPKKVVAQTAVVIGTNTSDKVIKTAVMPKDYVECPEGFTYTMAGNYGGHNISAGCYPTPSKIVLVDHDPMWGQDMSLILKNITTNQTL